MIEAIEALQNRRDDMRLRTLLDKMSSPSFGGMGLSAKQLSAFPREIAGGIFRGVLVDGFKLGLETPPSAEACGGIFDLADDVFRDELSLNLVCERQLLRVALTDAWLLGGAAGRVRAKISAGDLKAPPRRDLLSAINSPLEHLPNYSPAWEVIDAEILFVIAPPMDRMRQNVVLSWMHLGR